MGRKPTRRDETAKEPDADVRLAHRTAGRRAPPRAPAGRTLPGQPAIDPEALPLDARSPRSLDADLSPGRDANGAAAALANGARQSPSKAPMLPRGAAEGYDGWTVNRLARRSTPPPMAFPELDIELVGTRAAAQLTQAGAKSASEPAEPAVGPVSRAVPPSSAPLDSASADIPTEANCGDAWDLVDRSSASRMSGQPAGGADLIEEMEELYALDDFTGALRAAELVLGLHPGHAQALRCAHNSRRQLEQLLASKIGPLSQVPVVTLNDAEIRWLGLDHRAGFVLSRIDGNATLEELLDVCGMSRLEALQTVVELLNQGALRLGDG